MKKTLLIVVSLLSPLLLVANADGSVHHVKKNIITIEEEQGQELLEGSLHSDYDALKEFWVQQQPNHCGIASTVVTVNAIEGKVRLTQDNIFTDKVNELITQDLVSEQGLTLYEMGKLIKKVSKKAKARRYYSNIDTIETFRKHIHEAMENKDKYLIVNLSNHSIKGKGMNGGHFSPIGAYHEKSDRVLVYEVNPKKRPSYWVKVEDLFAAMHSIDPVSTLHRGWVLIRRKGGGNSKEKILLESDRGQELLKGAIRRDYDEQKEFWVPQLPSHCGVCSSVITLNTIEGEKRLDQYNIFTDEVNKIISQQTVSQIGLTLRQIELVLNASTDKGEAKKYYAHLTGLDFFREELKRIMKDEDAFMILNFKGHFSPAVAYNEEDDMVLIHEVSSQRTRKPRSYWISVKHRFKQMLAVDPISQISRGWVVVRRK